MIIRPHYTSSEPSYRVERQNFRKANWDIMRIDGLQLTRPFRDLLWRTQAENEEGERTEAPEMPRD